MSHVPTWRYLNLEHGWPLFRRDGLAIGNDGALRLASLPQLEPVGEPLTPLPGFEGVAGVAADECGNIWYADPAGHRIMHLPACAEQAEPLPCLRGPGSGPGQLETPRGIGIGRRGTLYIADSRNARIVLVDAATQQVRGYWTGGGTPSGEAFIEPWDVAVDACGNVYIADAGMTGPGGDRAGGSVRRFAPRGTPDPSFAAMLATQTVRPAAPIGLAIGLLGPHGGERLLVVDSRPARLLVYDLEGRYDATATLDWSRAIGRVDRPGPVVQGAGVLYVSDAASRRLLVFDSNGSFLGVAPGANASVAGLGMDCLGRLIVHPGGDGAIRRALDEPVFAGCGSFLAGPFSAATSPTRWQRIRLAVDPLPNGSHFRLFTLTSDTLDGSAGHSPGWPAACDGAPAIAQSFEGEQLAPLDEWRSAPRDAADFLALNQPGEFLWIAGLLVGNGNVTPTLRQVRLHHDEDGLLASLPALYRRAAGHHPFIERALALFETALDDEDDLLDRLPALFDADGAPDTPDSSWLEWLSGWVDAPLDEGWPDPVRRRTVRDAFASHARRGTRASLRRLVELYAGVTPIIEEAQPETPAWSLGQVSELGFGTRLAAAPADGAVLDRTAHVDHSHITPVDRGAPLFDATAHLFHVSVLAAGAQTAELEHRVRRVLDREKPAHTAYHLCVIGPRLRVGFQARVGIDAIVAGGPTAGTALDDSAELGHDTVIARPHGPGPTRLGHDARVGSTATLA
jgi:phage tail-like protein